MGPSQWALPAGLAVAGIGAVVTVGMLLGNRRRTDEQNVTAEERTQLALQRRQTWQRRLAVIALAIGCLMMFVLAGIAAWLSFGAQREYAHAHNGGDWDAATGFALLLDAGALSLSLIRFFEALTLRSSAITRILLLAFVSASAQMNLLHAPEAGAGSALLAVVPPLVYAVLLEMLLHKIEQVIMGRQKRRTADEERGYSLLLWLPWPIGAPVRMWRAWRAELLSTVHNVRVTGSRRPLPAAAEPASPASPSAAAGQVPLASAATAQFPSSAEAAASLAPAPAIDSPSAGARPAADESVQFSVPASPATSEPAITAIGSDALGKQEEEHEASLTAAVTGSGSSSEPDPVAESESEPGPEAPRPTAEAEPETAPRAVKTAEAEAAANEEDSPFTAVSHDSEAATADEDEAEASAVDDGPGAEERETQHAFPSSGTGDDEVREERRVQIDLSTLPEDEGPRQRAERIYVAHQVAGLPLDKADLARWAGYTNPRSGGNEYRRLVKEYGPILERKGAAYVDLDWSSLDQQGGPTASRGGAGDDRPHLEEARAA